jgi:hypothetical protein
MSIPSGLPCPKSPISNLVYPTTKETPMTNYWTDKIEELLVAGILYKEYPDDPEWMVFGYDYVGTLNFDESDIEGSTGIAGLIEHSIIKRLDEKLLAVNQFIDNDGQRKFAVEFYEVDWADYETVELGGKHLTDYSTRAEALYFSLPLLRKEEK